MKAATKTRAGPKRTTPGLRISGAVTNVRLRAEYHRDRLMQACITSWFKEAERLAGEYLQTGRILHLEAFIRHVEEMFAAIKRRISRIADKLENIGITVVEVALPGGSQPELFDLRRRHRWKDHGTGQGGDADFPAATCNLSQAEGARKLIELAGTGYKATPDLDSDGGY